MIEITKAPGLWTLTLARPDKANALTKEMLEALRDGARAAAEAGAQVLVLTGQGKVFSAGMDLAAAKEGLATDPVWEELSSAIAAFPGLSIAALNGTVAGGAMGMALAADLRIAAEGARAFYPVMRLGFLPQPSDPARLRALIGPARAKLILMGGAKLSTDEALAFGLFDRAVPPEALAGEVATLAADSLAATPEHVRALKGMTV